MPSLVIDEVSVRLRFLGGATVVPSLVVGVEGWLKSISSDVVQS